LVFLKEGEKLGEKLFDFWFVGTQASSGYNETERSLFESSDGSVAVFFFDSGVDRGAGDKDAFLRKSEVFEGVGFFDEFGYGFVVKNSVVKIRIFNMGEILRANVGVGYNLKNNMVLSDKNVASFVMERDDWLGDIFEVF